MKQFWGPPRQKEFDLEQLGPRTGVVQLADGTLEPAYISYRLAYHARFPERFVITGIKTPEKPEGE